MHNIDYDLEYSKAIDKMAKGGEVKALFKMDTPTGEPSKLTYIQQLLVRTKAFKEWFGDWESFANKILNERNKKTPTYEVEISLKKKFEENDFSNGNLSKNQKLLLIYFTMFNITDVSHTIDYDTLEPQSFWHGTKSEEFYEFRTDVRNTGRPYSYFAVNKEYSENFSEGKTLYSVFTCIKNPFIKFDITQGIAQAFVVDVFVDYGLKNGITGNDLKKLFEDEKYNYVKKSVFDNFPQKNNVPFWMLMARDNDGQFKRFLQELGYDGVMYMEEFVDVPDLSNKREITRAVTIFEPNQVKLADGRNTSFSSESNDIRYKKGGSLDGQKIAFITKFENNIYWLISKKDNDFYYQIDGDRRLYVVKDMAKRWGYKLVSPKEYNLYYNVPQDIRTYDNKNKYEKGGLLAPNGKKSNLTEEQYKLVRTPEFKKWFGFWDLYAYGKTNNYYEPSVRKLAKEVKEEKSSAIEEVANFLSKQVTKDDILIPMPSRKGIALDTKKLAEKISEKTGAKIFDCLLGKQRESIYDLKKRNENVSNFDFEFQLNCEIPKANNYFIVDNVIGTGVTMKNALKNVIEKVGNNVNPLVYAIDLNNISKVVDENGEPLVVYHSTDEKFNIFDYELINTTSNYYDIIGFYFSALKPKKSSPYGKYTKNFFLNIRKQILVPNKMVDKNPYWATNPLNKDDVNLLLKDIEPLHNEKTKEELIENIIKIQDISRQLLYIYTNFFSKWELKKGNELFLQNLIKKLGFDGAYMPHSEYIVAFATNQIKLADGTNTEFNSESDDIRYAEGGKIKMNRYAHLLGIENNTPKFAEGGSVQTEHGMTNNGKKGGYFEGRPHSEGGIKAWNTTTNSPIEVEGGEVIITKKAVDDDELYEFEGEMLTNKQILSKINESGGGVKFEDGGEIHQCNCSGKMFKFGGETLEDYKVINKMNQTYSKKESMKNRKTQYGHNLMRKMREGGFV